jgi:hypothetical protein
MNSMKQLLCAIIIAGVCGVSMAATATAPGKAPAKAAPAKSAPKKAANDPKWKNNSLAKKQAECRADPAGAKCAKKASK